MIEDKVYSMNQFSDLDFDPLLYKFMKDEGEYRAVLDCKRWGRKNNLVAYYTVDGVGKIVASTFVNRNYLHVRDIPIGSKLILTFSKRGHTGNYLRKIQVLDDFENVIDTFE